MKKPPSDVIELIIGIDLNPKDPKPINVDTNPSTCEGAEMDMMKGMGDEPKTDFEALLEALLAALVKADDRFSGLELDELIKANEEEKLVDMITKLLGGEGDDEEEDDEDPIEKFAGGILPKKAKPKFDDEEEDDPFSKFKKRGGGRPFGKE